MHYFDIHHHPQLVGLLDRSHHVFNGFFPFIVLYLTNKHVLSYLQKDVKQIVLSPCFHVVRIVTELFLGLDR